MPTIPNFGIVPVYHSSDCALITITSTTWSVILPFFQVIRNTFRGRRQLGGRICKRKMNWYDIKIYQFSSE